MGTWGAAQWVPTWADELTHSEIHVKEYAQICLAVGAITGTILAALAGDWLGRRWTYVLMCAARSPRPYGSISSTPHTAADFCWRRFFSAFAPRRSTVGCRSICQSCFARKCAATGQGFGFNFGRILAAIGTLQTGNLVAAFQGEVTVAGVTLAGGYPLAGTTMSLIYLAGIAVIWFAPETKGQPLPE